MITFPTGFVLPSSVEKQIKLAIHSSQMAFIVISPQEKADKKVAAQRARPASLAEHFEMFHISLGMKKPRGLRPQGVLSGSKAFAAGCQVMTEACTLRTFP
jgi:hypothetical protein